MKAEQGLGDSVVLALGPIRAQVDQVAKGEPGRWLGLPCLVFRIKQDPCPRPLSRVQAGVGPCGCSTAPGLGRLVVT